MTDDLEDLKTLMNAATPAPDAQRRAKNLESGAENFRPVPKDRATPCVRLSSEA